MIVIDQIGPLSCDHRSTHCSVKCYISIATDPNINQDEALINQGAQTEEPASEPDISNNMPPGFPGMLGPGMPPHGGIPNNNISYYYKWYWFWNTSGSMPVNFSEDYMLKTQVVPPVCPACPSCPKLYISRTTHNLSLEIYTLNGTT